VLELEVFTQRRALYSVEELGFPLFLRGNFFPLVIVVSDSDRLGIISGIS